MRWGRAGLGIVALILSAPAWGQVTARAQAWHDCNYCHNLHGGSFAALRDTAVIEDLCQSCHDPVTGVTTWDGKTVPNGVGCNGGSCDGFAAHDGPKHGGQPTTCWDCHNHHGEAGSNLSMILSNLETPNSGDRTVVFLKRGKDVGGVPDSLNSFADGDLENFDGVCEVCHTQTNYHLNAATPDSTVRKHNAGATCETCHKHADGYAGAPCAQCHDANGEATLAGRRDVITEITTYRSHHIQGAYQNSDCTTCHELSQHKQGTVRVFNADDASVIVVDTVNNAAGLEPFCLSCHDSDGAGGTGPPFSGGIDPPDVASTWTLASHNTTAGSTCWDCHNNGHASQKRKILAPWDAGPGTNNVDEEEGFCFDCHSSTGVASSDVEAQFDTVLNPIRWAQDSWGLNSIANFNDRHDVTPTAQSGSGAKVECTDCHDPHQANAAQPWKHDPDPGDAHSDTSLAARDWTGQTKLSWFCVDCHDGSFPSTVQDHQPDSMVNILNTWLTVDRMGVLSSGGNEQLRTQGIVDNGAGASPRYTIETLEWTVDDILNCEVCHRAHPKTGGEYGDQPDSLRHDLFALQDSVRNNGLPLAWSLLPITTPDDSTFWYSLTTDVKRNATPNTAGGYFCNTCHNRDGMNGKNTCGSSNCHAHGGSPGM